MDFFFMVLPFDYVGMIFGVRASGTLSSKDRRRERVRKTAEIIGLNPRARETRNICLVPKGEKGNKCLFPSSPLERRK